MRALRSDADCMADSLESIDGVSKHKWFPSANGLGSADCFRAQNVAECRMFPSAHCLCARIVAERNLLYRIVSECTVFPKHMCLIC